MVCQVFCVLLLTAAVAASPEHAPALRGAKEQSPTDLKAAVAATKPEEAAKGTMNVELPRRLVSPSAIQGHCKQDLFNGGKPASDTKIVGKVDLGYSAGVARIFPQFGSPAGEMVESTFDTGSMDTWAQLSSCKLVQGTQGYPQEPMQEYSGTCIEGDGNIQRNNANLTEPGSCYNAVYGTGSGVAGWVSQEMVQLGGASFKSNVGLINYVGHLFLADKSAGIVGVSPAPVERPHYANDAVAQRAADGVFTICLPRCERDAPGAGQCYPASYTAKPGNYSGFVCFGDACETEVCSIPESSRPWAKSNAITMKVGGFWQWALPLTALSVGTRNTHEIFTPAQAKSDLQDRQLNWVMMDSGTSLIKFESGIRDAVFQAVKKTLEANPVATCTEKEVQVQTETALTLQCQGVDIEDWPPLVVSMGGVTLTIDPQTFVTIDRKTSSTSWTVQYCVGKECDGLPVILGSVLFNQFKMKFSGLGKVGNPLWMSFAGVGAEQATSDQNVISSQQVLLVYQINELAVEMRADFNGLRYWAIEKFRARQAGDSKEYRKASYQFQIQRRLYTTHKIEYLQKKRALSSA